MKKAYIILAHQREDQLYRLLERLDDGNAHFFLHIDKKVPLDLFVKVINKFGSKLLLVDRVEIEWAGFGLVEATLSAMREIDKHPVTFEWISLLSGLDYPIKTNDFINRFFNETDQSGFVEYTQLPDDKRWQPRGGYYRIDKYYFGLSTTKRYAAKSLNFLAMFLPFARRPLLKLLQPFAGSQWWTIDQNLLNYIIKYVDDNPHYYRFHKHTFAADEVFFHTIMLNAPDELKTRITNNNLRFISWPDTSNAHPLVLTRDDFKMISNSGALFARKFDQQKDKEILDLIDREILGIEQVQQEYKYIA